MRDFGAYVMWLVTLALIVLYASTTRDVPEAPQRDAPVTCRHELVSLKLEGPWTWLTNDSTQPVRCYSSVEQLIAGNYAVYLHDNGGRIAIQEGKLICVVDVAPPARNP